MNSNRTIDHLVYAVPDFEKAFDDFEKLLGVRPVFGGHHTTKGTKNALINLGNECYLEILAIDEANQKIHSPRWMGIDLIQKPTMTRWCLKSEKLEKDAQILRNYDPKSGEISSGQRKTGDGKLLNWNMILPLAEPEVDLIPFMINWERDSVHPTANLEEKCCLVGMEFTHPNPDILKPIWEGLSLDFEIKRGEKLSISVQIECPNGIIEI